MGRCYLLVGFRIRHSVLNMTGLLSSQKDVMTLFGVQNLLMNTTYHNMLHDLNQFTFPWDNPEGLVVYREFHGKRSHWLDACTNRNYVSNMMCFYATPYHESSFFDSHFNPLNAELET